MIGCDQVPHADRHSKKVKMRHDNKYQRRYFTLDLRLGVTPMLKDSFEWFPEQVR